MTNATNFIKQNLGIIGAGIGGAALGGVLGYAAGRASNSASKRKRRKSKNKSARKGNRVYRKQKGRRYTPHTAGKRRDTSHKRIRYTKNGQPYIILASGKARFIRKKGARISHKRSGGRY